MNNAFLNRIIGALVVLAVIAIFLPLLLQKAQPLLSSEQGSQLPAPPTRPDVKMELPEPLLSKAEKELQPDQPPVKAMPQISERDEGQPEKPKSTVAKPVKKVQPMASKKQWLIQLATFQQEKSALALKKRLKDLVLPVQVRSFSTKQGKTLYRVLVGPSADLNVLHTLQQQLDETLRVRSILRHSGGKTHDK